MKNFFNKIIQFFKNLVSRNNIKKLEPAKDNNIDKKNEIINNIQENNTSNDIEKQEFFDIYNMIKNGSYDLNKLTKEDAKKVIAILKSEIDLKEKKLSKNITELNILKYDNKAEEKNRIFEIYNNVKNGEIDLTTIDKEDLLKIRKILLEEAKIQDNKFEDEIQLLEIIQKRNFIAS